EPGLAGIARAREVHPRLSHLVLERHRNRASACGGPDLWHSQSVGAERELGAGEGRHASIDRELPREQVVVDRRLRLLELPREQVLHAGTGGARVIQRVLDLLLRERLLELRDDVALLVTERSGEVLVDFLRRPLVLAAVALGERALHL